MAGGFTKFPKLQVEDLGTEGTGDRIALFDSDGKVVGYMMATDGFVPLSGTEVGKPITGDIEVDGLVDFKIKQTGESLKEIELTGDDDILMLTNKYLTNLSKSSISIQPYQVGIINEITGIYNNGVLINNLGVFILEENNDTKGIYANKLFNKQNDPNAFAQLGDLATTLVRDTETITNLAAETDAFVETIFANTIGEKDVINGTFIFNCLVATTKVDYKVIIAGIDVAVFSQVGYQAVNESTEISIKIFREGNKLKVSSSLIGGTTVVYSFYYETTSFDFLESNELKVTMKATNENEVSVQFAELILSK